MTDTADQAYARLHEADLLAVQPLSNVQWVRADRLSANAWNPNRQAPPEFRLLKVSILENGWTQPIVIREHDGGARLEIVDGFHRWTLASTDKEVAALTTIEGVTHVPVVTLPETSDEVAKAATIRHNRARGSHGVLKMADLVASLLADGRLSPEEVGVQLGMDDEEVERLADRGDMLNRGTGDSADFNTGWTV